MFYLKQLHVILFVDEIEEMSGQRMPKSSWDENSRFARAKRPLRFAEAGEIGLYSDSRTHFAPSHCPSVH